MKLTRRQQLTPRQERFVSEYLLDLNGGRAAIRAGYSPNGADQRASELLRIEKVKAAVERALARRVSRIRIRQDDVLRELKRLALANPAKAFGPEGRLLPIHEIPEDLQRAIASVDLKDGNPVRVRFHSKPEVLALLARHVGLVDKHQEKQEEGGFVLNIKVGPPPEPKEVVDGTVSAPAQLPSGNGERECRLAGPKSQQL